MGKIKFDVQGSAEEPYEVEFIYKSGTLRALCNCTAGTYGSMCKHRVSILGGDISSIVSSNISDVETVVVWAEKSGVIELLVEIQNKKILAEKAKNEVKEAKQKLLKTLMAA